MKIAVQVQAQLIRELIPALCSGSPALYWYLTRNLECHIDSRNEGVAMQHRYSECNRQETVEHKCPHKKHLSHSSCSQVVLEVVFRPCPNARRDLWLLHFLFHMSMFLFLNSTSVSPEHVFVPITTQCSLTLICRINWMISDTGASNRARVFHSSWA